MNWPLNQATRLLARADMTAPRKFFVSVARTSRWVYDGRRLRRMPSGATLSVKHGGATRMSDAAEYTPPKVWVFNKPTEGRFANINRPTSGAQHEKELPVGKHPLQLYSLGTPN